MNNNGQVIKPTNNQDLASTLVAKGAYRQVSSVYCSKCRKTPTAGLRYTCLTCSHYDLCRECNDSGIHDDHPMAYIKIDKCSWPYFDMPDGSMLSIIALHGSVYEGCSFCGKKSVNWVKCSTCVGDCKFCADCFQLKSKHNIHVLRPPTSEPPSLPTLLPGYQPYSVVVCSVCRKLIVAGLRYSCLTCSEYDLCKICKEAGNHDNHSLAYIQSSNFAWPYYRQADGTMPSMIGLYGPIARGCSLCGKGKCDYYPCSQCPPNFKFCKECTTLKKSRWIHIVLPSKSQGSTVKPAAVHNLGYASDINVVCSVCSYIISSGRRYSCLTCIEYDLCQNCKNGGNHDNHAMAYMMSSKFPWPYFRAKAGLKSVIGLHGSTASGCSLCGANAVELTTCPQCPKDCKFCEDCFKLKEKHCIHVLKPAAAVSNEPPRNEETKRVETTTSMFRLFGFRANSVPRGAKPGMYDVTKALSTKIEKLMNESILNQNDLGKGRDADGKTFSKFKVTAVHQIVIDKNKLSLYRQHLKCIEAKKPPRLVVNIDSNAEWLADLIEKPQANEVFLFHGTKKDFSEIIATSGFDARVGDPNGLFGAGIYFAENADKSDQYTQHPKRQLFLARVILGNPHTVLKPEKFRRPPLLNPSDPKSDLHDSVIARSKRKGFSNAFLERHQEFIIYNGEQCIPVFLIDYEHE